MRRVLRLPVADPSYEAVRAWTDDVCRRLCAGRLSESGLAAIVLAVHETVRNVVEHACPDASGSIEVAAEADGEILRLSVAHEGCPFDRATAPVPVFDGTAERGFGVFLTAAAVDRVEYGRADDGRACVWMEKCLGVPGGGESRAATAPDERKGR